jgi:hypothetical protein
MSYQYIFQENPETRLSDLILQFLTQTDTRDRRSGSWFVKNANKNQCPTVQMNFCQLIKILPRSTLMPENWTDWKRD